MDSGCHVWLPRFLSIRGPLAYNAPVFPTAVRRERRLRRIEPIL